MEHIARNRIQWIYIGVLEVYNIAPNTQGSLKARISCKMRATNPTVVKRPPARAPEAMAGLDDFDDVVDVVDGLDLVLPEGCPVGREYEFREPSAARRKIGDCPKLLEHHIHCRVDGKNYALLDAYLDSGSSTTRLGTCRWQQS